MSNSLKSKYFVDLFDDLLELKNEVDSKKFLMFSVRYDRNIEKNNVFCYIRCSISGRKKEFDDLKKSDVYKNFFEKYKDDIYEKREGVPVCCCLESVDDVFEDFQFSEIEFYI